MQLYLKKFMEDVSKNVGFEEYWEMKKNGQIREYLDTLKSRLLKSIEQLEHLKKLKDNQDTLSKLEYCELARNFYEFRWDYLSGYNLSTYNIDYIGKDEIFKKFLEVLMGTKYENLKIYRKAKGKYTFYTRNLSEDEHTAKFEFMGHSYWSEHLHNLGIAPRYIRHVSPAFWYEPIFDDKWEGILDLHFFTVIEDPYGYYERNDISISGEDFQRSIQDGRKFILLNPDKTLPFPNEYYIIEDLNKDSFNCIFEWLSQIGTKNKKELTGYQKAVLKALNTCLIPKLKKIIKDRIQEDYDEALELLKEQRENYQYFIDACTEFLDAKKKIIEEDIELVSRYEHTFDEIVEKFNQEKGEKVLTK